MNRSFRSKSIALVAFSACSLFALADSVLAQQPGGGGGNQPGNGQRQPGQRGNRNNGGQPGGGGGFGGGGGMFGGGRAMFDPSVSTEDMDKYGKVLNLSKAQQTAVKALHDSFVQDYTTAAEKVRDEMDAIREDAREDPSRFQEIGELMTKFRTKRADMEKAFFTDVKTTLTPEQATQWPAIERMRRRETSMNRGMMSGERVDLIKIVEGLKLSAEQKKGVDPVLEQYSVDLDRELVARNDYQDKMQGQMRDMFGPNADQSKAEKMLTDGRAIANKLRDVNKRYSRQVENALPDEASKTKFQSEVRRESYPQIYRQSRSTRQIDEALALKSLSAEQKASIEGIKSGLDRDVSGVNQKMETAYEQREQSLTASDIMGRFGGGGGGGPGGRGRGGFGMVDSEELTTLRDQRDDLEKAAVDKVMAILNEEQKADMPQQRQRGGGNGDANGNGGGGRGGDNGGNNGGGRRGGRPGGNTPPAPTGRT
jgi:hypothetical protein